MSNLRDSLGASGFDPNYETITAKALKRGRNGDGRRFEVNVTTRAGEHLGTISVSGAEVGAVGQAVDMAVDYEVGVEILGQRIADLLISELAIQRTQGCNGDSQIYVRV